jgi:16S rRNA (cytidine1402-2'-O)-methyltransferase
MLLLPNWRIDLSYLSMSDKTYHIGAHGFQADRLEAGLYLVSTPIGNLGDMTLRSLNALAVADVIYCEDTRITPRLLERFGIKNKLKPYHDHNSDGAGVAIITAIHSGHVVALVSDAGTPLISDPGFALVRDCVAAGLRVEALPGASALLPALQLSGLPTNSFSFLGFLPQKHNERLKILAEIDDRSETVVVYESPYRILDALDDIQKVLGTRPLSVSREISKMHEETIRGTAQSIRDALAAKPSIKGEFVVVIGAQEKFPEAVTEKEIADAIAQALLDHPSGKAASLVSKKLGLPRDDVYARILSLKGKA